MAFQLLHAQIARVLTRWIVGVAAIAAVGAQRPASEVASVKPNRSGEQRQGIRSEPGGRIVVSNMPLQALITFAYELANYQLVGAPNWAATERFDAVAKLAGDPAAIAPAGANPIRAAMQTLLEDRFKLRSHRESRDMDIYALVMARVGGAPGPQLKPSSQDCDVIAAANRRGGTPPGPPKPGEPVVCSVIVTGGGLIRFGGFPIARLLAPLGAEVGRLIVDRTGLMGNWDFDLRYGPDPRYAPDPDAPSLFTALREQLGLKLESARGPVQVLVVDAVERPEGD